MKKSLKLYAVMFICSFLFLSVIATWVWATCPPEYPTCDDPCEYGCGCSCCSLGTPCKGNCCTGGAICCDGSCVTPCGSSCPCSSGQICCDGECTSNCRTFKEVPAYTEPCPNCEGPLIGCTGSTTVRISYLTPCAAEPGDFGWCKVPYKREVIGHIYECAADWNPGIIAGCSGLVALTCVSTGACATIPSCAICLVLGGAECAFPDGICTFMNGCVQGNVLETLEAYVIDQSGGWGSSCVIGI